MLANTLRRYNFTADYYEYRYVDLGNGTGNEKEFYFDHTLRCLIIPQDSGDIVIYTPDSLRIGAHLTNVKDRDGVVLTAHETRPQGFTYYIESVDPVLNGFGFIDGLRYRGTRSRS